MEVLLLKSGACLAILMLFYKLVLENQSFHQFKRFYLLGAITASLIIPFVSFTQYVEVVPVENLDLSSALTPYLQIDGELQDVERPINYYSIILWSIYGLGVLVFLFRFVKNLSRLLIKIKVNEKIKKTSYTEVLLKQLEPPHTFFNYIFFNRDKAKAKAIPNEVVLHEASHAKQKHSLDILFVEILQIVFWFNPLLYFIKKDIKLNHEFLADAEVLNNDIESAHYKKILLEFANPHQDYALANTINYSSIKKRFTVMKKQTSKKRLWLSTFVLLPLLGLLLYSFSSREIIEVDTHSARSLDIEVLENGGYTINDIKTNKADFVKTANKFHQDISSDVRNRIINIHLSFEAEETEEQVWFVYNSLLDYGFHRLATKNQEVVKSKGNMPLSSDLNESSRQNPPTKKEIIAYNNWAKKMKAEFKKRPKSETVNGHPYMINDESFRYYNAIFDRMTSKQKNEAESMPEAVLVTEWPMPTYEIIKTTPIKEQKNPPTPKEVAAYNTWAKNINDNTKAAEADKTKKYPIVKQKEVEKYKAIYYRMSEKQKANAQPWPNFPPPPPPPPAPKKGNNNLPSPPPPNTSDKQVAAYNAWAKKINDKTKAAEADKTKKYPIVKHKEVVKYKAIYSRMSEKQKANAQSWPNFPPPAPPTPHPGYNKNKKGGPNAEAISNYNSKLNSGKFQVQLKKEDEHITLKCIRGCKWKNLKFDLEKDSPIIVNHYGLNKVDPQSSNKTFYFVLHQDDDTFTLKSTKNTSWKGFSSSSEDNLDLIFSNEDVKRNKK